MLVNLRQFYYAIGNNPATNIFCTNESSSLEKVEPIGINSWRYQTLDPSFESALKPQSKDIRVLCLACGDLRNVLFSLTDTAGIGKINLVINDYDVHVLARNILILDAIFEPDDDLDASETTESIFCIWFSTGLKRRHLDFLHRRLLKLIRYADCPSQGEKHSWRWACHENDLLESLRVTWEKWLSIFTADDVDNKTEVQAIWKKTQTMRQETFLTAWQRITVGYPSKDSENHTSLEDSLLSI
jgi:hypothetical protein